MPAAAGEIPRRTIAKSMYVPPFDMPADEIRRELDRLAGTTNERGLTLVPTRIYFSGSRAKVEIAVARGKDRYDKRQAIKERETRRDMQRALGERE